MSQIPHIPVPFANSGDKADIPVTTTTEGRMSWDKGLDVSHLTPFKDGGKLINRKDLNAILNILSSHLVNLQNGGSAVWNNTTNYPIGSHVKGSDGFTYRAKDVNGPATVISDPITSVDYWSRIPTMDDIAAVTGIDIATVIDIVTGTDNEKLITPLGLAGAISQIAPTDEDLTNLQSTLQTAIDTKATPAQIQDAITALIDSSPEALNTLNELAAALGDDPNFATTVAAQIGSVDTKATNAQTTADSKWTAVNASTETQGIVELATTEEVLGGTDTSRAITPEALALALPTIVSSMVPAADVATKSSIGVVQIGNNLNITEEGVVSVSAANTTESGVTQLYDGVDSTSINLAATANATKVAYDKGVEGLNKAIEASEAVASNYELGNVFIRNAGGIDVDDIGGISLSSIDPSSNVYSPTVLVNHLTNDPLESQFESVDFMAESPGLLYIGLVWVDNTNSNVRVKIIRGGSTVVFNQLFSNVNTIDKFILLEPKDILQITRQRATPAIDKLIGQVSFVPEYYQSSNIHSILEHAINTGQLGSSGKSIFNGNVDVLFNAGTYEGSWVNSPELINSGHQYGTLVVFGGESDGYRLRTTQLFSSGTMNNIYMRTRNNTTNGWNDWRDIFKAEKIIEESQSKGYLSDTLPTASSWDVNISGQYQAAIETVTTGTPPPYTVSGEGVVHGVLLVFTKNEGGGANQVYLRAGEIFTRLKYSGGEWTSWKLYPNIDIVTALVNTKWTAVNASTTVKGIVERADYQERVAGTDNEKYMTPLGTKEAINMFAPSVPVTATGANLRGAIRNIISFTNEVNKTFTFPDGGTWFYYIALRGNNTPDTSGCRAGVIAGGGTITGLTTARQINGFMWRIA